MSQLAHKLARFTQQYCRHLNTLLSERASEIPYHSDLITTWVLIEASDAIVTFYFPQDLSHRSLPPGGRVLNHSQLDLNTVLQSISQHLAAVTIPVIGQQFADFTKRPRPRNITRAIGTLPWVNYPLLHHHVTNHPNEPFNTTAIEVTPICRVQRGTIMDIVPGRTSIWSPVVTHPSLGTLRFNQWTHFDVWWRAHELDLSKSNAIDFANVDILAITLTNRLYASFPSEIAQIDRPTDITNRLAEMISDLRTLLDTHGSQEEVLHQWLLLNEHHIFLEPESAQVWNKPQFGNQAVDFLIRRSDSSYRLIEIETAHTPIFRTGNSEPTAQCNHARQQVIDAQRYIRDNIHTVRAEMNLEGIYEPAGLVIIGRSAMLSADIALRRWRDMKMTTRVDMLTFDDLLARVAALANSLKSVQRLASPQ